MTSAQVTSSAQSGDERKHRRRIALGVAAVLVSPTMWLASLWLSYAVQDFACSAAASADAEAPDSGLLITLMVMNAVLFVITAVSGLVGGVLAHRSRARDRGTAGGEGQHSGIVAFLGWTAVVSALLFSYGIILISVNPLVFEVCS